MISLAVSSEIKSDIAMTTPRITTFTALSFPRFPAIFEASTGITLMSSLVGVYLAMSLL